MCDMSVRFGVERFLHISTDEVYGSIEEGSFTETDTLAPRSPYSAAKAGSDLIALAYHETHGLPVVLTRSSNQFGPYQFPEKLIPYFVTSLLDGKRVPLYGDGLNVRDWLFVRDNCDGVDLVLRQGEVGEIYNIGAGNERTNREITDRLLAILGKDESSVEYVEDRKGHDRRYSIATDKVAELGWQARRSFDEALEETVRFYTDNRSWWEPLTARVKNR
jgi:dTDP-glucose 4,6-dehydratase